MISSASFLLISAALVSAQSYGPCTYNGKNGQCIDQSDCNGQSFASSVGANGCQAFATAIKCCIASSSSSSSSLPAGPACVAYSRSGTCVSSCPSPFHHYASTPGSVTGCESYPTAVKCCSPGTPSSSGNSDPKPSGSSNSDPNEVPQAAIDIIKQFEGFFSRAYPDPRTGGKPITIGWGSTRRRDGSEFRLGDTITREAAADLLSYQIETHYLASLKRIPVWNSLNSNQRAALISFAYNVGAAFYGNSGYRTITNVIANKQWSKIRAALLLYRNPGSNVEAGLRRRRTAEADLFLKPVTNSAGLEEEPIPQVPLDPSEDEDNLDPDLHPDNSVAIGLGVTAGIVVLACIIAAVVWVCVGKRTKANAAAADGSSAITMSGTYKSSYTCSHCKTNFFSADDLTEHVAAAHP